MVILDREEPIGILEYQIEIMMNFTILVQTHEFNVLVDRVHLGITGDITLLTDEGRNALALVWSTPEVIMDLLVKLC